MISTARPGSACFTPRSSSGRPQSRSAPKLPALAMSGRSQMGNSTSSAADVRVRKLQGLLDSQKQKMNHDEEVSSNKHYAFQTTAARSKRLIMRW
jgi:hypothetical protein